MTRDEEAAESKLFFDRVAREYPPLGSSIIGGLERFASEDPQKEKWFNTFFDTHLFYDWFIDFRTDCELLLRDVCNGKITYMNRATLKELLRVCYLYERMVMKTTDEIEKAPGAPTDFREINKLLVTHPMWKRAAEQSRKVLALIRLPQN